MRTLSLKENGEVTATWGHGFIMNASPIVSRLLSISSIRMPRSKGSPFFWIVCFRGSLYVSLNRYYQCQKGPWASNTCAVVWQHMMSWPSLFGTVRGHEATQRPNLRSGYGWGNSPVRYVLNRVGSHATYISNFELWSMEIGPTWE